MSEVLELGILVSRVLVLKVLVWGMLVSGVLISAVLILGVLVLWEFVSQVLIIVLLSVQRYTRNYLESQKWGNIALDWRSE